MRFVKDPDKPEEAKIFPLASRSPPKTAVPDTDVFLLPTAPLTKKKTSLPISAGASGTAGEDWGPTNATAPVVKSEPTVVDSKNPPSP